MSYFPNAGSFAISRIPFLFLIVLLCTNACSRVEDQQLDFAKAPPEAIIQQVKTRVPDATQINFSPVVPGKIWLAHTYSASKIHQLAVSRSALLLHLSSYSKAPPQDIQNALGNLDFPAGIFDETKEVQDPGNPGYREFQSVYVIRNERFLLTSKAEPGSGRLSVNIHPRAYSQFVSTDFDDLPSAIQKLPVSRNGFQSVTITEEGNGVIFQLQFRDGVLEVSDDLEILYSDLGDTADIAHADLPGQISEWVGSNPPPAGLSDFSCRQFRFGNEQGYRVIFQNSMQKVHLFFDISGKLRYQYFTASIPAS